MISVKQYTTNDKELWDAFIEKAKNATFLFKRDFMEYHQDRFQDFSLLVLDEDELVAVLPANQVSKHEIASHQGLTYGGLVIEHKHSVEKVFKYFHALLKWLNEQGIDTLTLKQLPDFLALCSQKELDYAFFLAEAKNYRTDIAFVVDNESTFKRKMPKGRKSEIKKAEKLGVSVKETTDLVDFWEGILTPNLQERFGVKPVHSVEEITLLNNRFPNNIKQFNAYHEGQLVAGATIFESRTTAHVQYLAGNDQARNCGALDYLFHTLIDLYSTKKRYFDFGIVNENNGKTVNYGMMKWKESFGARAFLHQFFQLSTANFDQLNLDLISK